MEDRSYVGRAVDSFSLHVKNEQNTIGFSHFDIDKHCLCLFTIFKLVLNENQHSCIKNIKYCKGQFGHFWVLVQIVYGGYRPDLNIQKMG